MSTKRGGMGAHQSASAETVVWLTPPEVITALGGADSFAFDPCAAMQQPWHTAKWHWTEETDGLKQDWDGRGFWNPPYSTPDMATWMPRFARHGRGTALVFARTETETFHRHVWQRAHAVLMLRGRLHFHFGIDYIDKAGRQWYVGDRAPFNAGAPSVLIAYGMEDLDILAAAKLDGKLVCLRLPRSVLVQALDESWRTALRAFIAQQRGPVALDVIYRAFAEHQKAQGKPHWREKIRQTLNRGGFTRVGRGAYMTEATA